jgi:hypothetical protein
MECREDDCSVGRDVRELFNRQLSSDITVCAQDPYSAADATHFYCHRAILAGRSIFWSKLFRATPSEALQSAEVNLVLLSTRTECSQLVATVAISAAALESVLR